MATPHAGQNAISGTTCWQCGHTTGSSELDLVVRLVQKRELKAESQQEECDQRHCEMNEELDGLRYVRDVDDAE